MSERAPERDEGRSTAPDVGAVRAALRALGDPAPGVFALLAAAERLADLAPQLALLEVSPFGTMPEPPAGEKAEQARAAARSRMRRLQPTSPPTRPRGAPSTPTRLPVGERSVERFRRGPVFSFRAEPRPPERPARQAAGAREPSRVEERIVAGPLAERPEGVAAEEWMQPQSASEDALSRPVDAPAPAPAEASGPSPVEGTRPLAGGELLAELVEAAAGGMGRERGSSTSRARGAPEPGRASPPARGAPAPSDGALSRAGAPVRPSGDPDEASRPPRPSGDPAAPPWAPGEASSPPEREWSWPGGPSLVVPEEPRGARVEPQASPETPPRGASPPAKARGEAVEPAELAALVNEALIEQAQRHGVDLL